MLPGADLTKADTDAIPWQEITTTCAKKECAAYTDAFFAQAKEAEARDDAKSAALLYLLGAICSFHLKLDDPDVPFMPVLILPTSRSSCPEDLDDAHFNLLLDLAPTTTDSELQARFADILWVCQRNFRMALLAVDAYLESARRLEDPEHWHTGVQRVERAVQIAALLGPRNAALPNVITYIEDRLAHYNGDDPLFLSVSLMELLQDQRQGDPAIYAPLAEKMALHAEANRNWHKARSCWAILARWQRTARDATLERNAQLRLAETYVQEADAVLVATPDEHSIAAHHLQQAIAALRRVGGAQERVTELHHRLLAHQRQSSGQMQVATTSIDVSDLAGQARNAVSGKEPLEALVRLGLLARPLSMAKLREEVRRTVRDHPLQFLFPGVMLNNEGKVIARRPSMSPIDLEADEALLRTEMFHQANWHHQTFALGGVEHARQQINLEHAIHIRDIASLVADNPFIPLGREWIYARGLQAGLTGDSLVAVHLLIPQIEHSLRALLTEAGVLVSSIDSSGIQDEHNINLLLYRAELKSILGEDIVFELQGLLVERYGVNMRNRMAHGLIQAEEFNSASAVYLWWLTLHLCCLPVAHRFLKQSAETTSPPTSDTQEET